MTIDRYLRKEVLANLFGVLTVLLLIFLGNRFVRILGDSLEGQLPHDAILTILFLKLVSALVAIIPLALYLAVLLGFGRLYRDNEMTALHASGVSTFRLLKSIFGLVMPIAIGIALLSLYLSPWAEEQVKRIQDEVRARTEVFGITAGKFIEDKRRDGVLYVENIEEQGQLTNIFAQWQTEEGRLATITAKQGHVENNAQYDARYLVLEEGFRYEGEPDQIDFRIIRFQRHTIYIEPQQIKVSHRREKAQSTLQLLQSDSVKASAEFQRRLSMPISTLLLALLAIPLSKTNPRQGRYFKLLIAILVYALYSNALTVAQSWVGRGVLPPELGLWWVHIVILSVIVIWVARLDGFRFRSSKAASV